MSILIGFKPKACVPASVIVTRPRAGRERRPAFHHVRDCPVSPIDERGHCAGRQHLLAFFRGQAELFAYGVVMSGTTRRVSRSLRSASTGSMRV